MPDLEGPWLGLIEMVSSPLGLILLIILIVLLLGAWPRWPYSATWGYYPMSGLGLVLIIVLILVLFGHL
jgi:hypothetical protein